MLYYSNIIICNKQKLNFCFCRVFVLRVPCRGWWELLSLIPCSHNLGFPPSWQFLFPCCAGLSTADFCHQLADCCFGSLRGFWHTKQLWGQRFRWISWWSPSLIQGHLQPWLISGGTRNCFGHLQPLQVLVALKSVSKGAQNSQSSTNSHWNYPWDPYCTLLSQTTPTFNLGARTHRSGNFPLPLIYQSSTLFIPLNFSFLPCPG